MSELCLVSISLIRTDKYWCSVLVFMFEVAFDIAYSKAHRPKVGLNCYHLMMV